MLDMGDLNSEVRIGTMTNDAAENPVETETRPQNKLMSLLRKIKKQMTRLFQIVIVKSCFITTNKTVNMCVLFAVVSLAFWSIMYLCIGAYALPGGVCFSLFVLVVSCHIVGYLFEKIKIPNLLGMLLVGLFFRNVPVLSIVGKSIDSNTSAILRQFARPYQVLG